MVMNCCVLPLIFEISVTIYPEKLSPFFWRCFLTMRCSAAWNFLHTPLPLLSDETYFYFEADTSPTFLEEQALCLLVFRGMSFVHTIAVLCWYSQGLLS